MAAFSQCTHTSFPGTWARTSGRGRDQRARGTLSAVTSSSYKSIIPTRSGPSWWLPLILIIGLPRWLSGKESTCQCRRHKRSKFNSCVRKILWRRKWQPTPVFLPGKSPGQRTLSIACGISKVEQDWATNTFAIISAEALEPNILTLGSGASTHKFGQTIQYTASLKVVNLVHCYRPKAQKNWFIQSLK